MKLLFSVGILEKKLNASNRIAINIASEIAKIFEIECVVCGLSKEVENAEISFSKGVKLIRLPKSKKIYTAERKFDRFLKDSNCKIVFFRQLCFSLVHPISSFFLWLKHTKWYNLKKVGSTYKKEVEKILKKEKFDALIFVYMPVTMCFPLLKIRNLPQIYTYQLDPWAVTEVETHYLQKDRVQQESALFSASQAIFTTPLLFKQYNQLNFFSEFRTKMYALEFPNIIKYQPLGKEPFRLDEKSFNIVYCGTIDDSYRNPKSFLQIVEQLLLNGAPIKAYFVGEIESPILNDYASRYPANIVIKEKVTDDNALSLMNKADFLLSIGNTLSNQVPSKIFDYFSIGKPIIHVQNIENCSSIPYLKQYPLCCICSAFGDFSIDNIYKFLVRYKGKQVEFSEVQTIFQKCTVNYVAKEMADILLKSSI